MKTESDSTFSTTDIVANVSFNDIFDIDEIQRLQDLFSDATGVASIITQTDGTPITNPSNFCRLCINIIRETEKGCANCFKSDAILGRYNPSGPVVQPCLSGGLWDAGASISVGGKHIANWLIGQVRNLELDEQRMIEYADEIGANKKDFMEALSEVPLMSLDKFNKVAQMLFAYANELSEKAYKNVVLTIQIAERKRAEEIIRTTKRLLEQTIEQSPVPMILVSMPDAVIRMVNSACLRFFCVRDISSVINTPLKELKSTFQYFDIQGKQESFENQSFIRNLFKGIKTEGEEFYLVHEDGSIRYLLINSIPIFDDTGNIIAGYVIMLDISDRKKAELIIKEKCNEIEVQNEEYLQMNEELLQMNEELQIAKDKAEESDRLKSAFLANMSHEIRTPMNGILGFADLLKEPHLSDEEQQSYISIIKKSGNRMLNIINDIINISKVESGLMDVLISQTDINEKLEYIYTFFKPEVEQKGIQLFYKNALTIEEATIYTDREKIYGILTNLVKNAIKFTIEGSIELGYEKKGEYLEFYVKDTGTGIREEQKHLIFERFRQGSESLSRNYEGAGLGLSISKAYVEMLGGKIWVESVIGKGSTFYFTIPYVLKEYESFEKNSEEQDVCNENIQRKLKILIAEDDEPSSRLIALTVKALSYEMLLVKNGLEAVEACRNNSDIDLILMDNKMAQMDGYEATRQIRLFNKDVIIISQTAFALTGDREKVLKAGCNDYITKPFNPKALRDLIKKYF